MLELLSSSFPPSAGRSIDKFLQSLSLFEFHKYTLGGSRPNACTIKTTNERNATKIFY